MSVGRFRPSPACTAFASSNPLPRGGAVLFREVTVWEVTMASEEQIRRFAHQLWEKAGRPVGRDDEFWHAAEVELNAESESPAAPIPSEQPNANSLPG